MIYFFQLSLALSIWVALGDVAAWATLSVATTILILIAFKSVLVIEIDEKELRVGQARINLEFLAEAQSLSEIQMRTLRTRDADPAAFLGIRFWTATGVKVTLNDSRDPTPYWLITSKNGEVLSQLLNAISD